MLLRDEGATKDRYDEALDEETTHLYRALVARANYLSPDRPDIAFAAKELAKKMGVPTEHASHDYLGPALIRADPRAHVLVFASASICICIVSA